MIPLLLALCAPAQAVELSVGLSPAVQLHTGPRSLAVGVGGLAALRAQLHPQASVHFELGAMSYGAPFIQADLGALWHLRPEATWRPALGMELASSWGGTVRIIEAGDDWRSGAAPLLGARVLVRPLCFERGVWTASALNLAAGVGLEAPGRTLSLGMELFTLERRL